LLILGLGFAFHNGNCVLSEMPRDVSEYQARPSENRLDTSSLMWIGISDGTLLVAFAGLTGF